MLRVVAHVRDRHLVRAPGALDRQPVDLAGPVQPFGVRRTIIGHLGRAAERLRARAISSSASSSAAAKSRCTCVRVVAGDEQRPVPVALHQRDELVLGDAREHRRVRDLVAVQVEDRQHRAVALRVQELVRVPARRERPGLGLAVADDAADEQVRVVERRAVGVRQRVAELAALVDRPRRLGRDVARDPAGERELAEEPAHPGLVPADRRVELGVRALEVGVGDDPRAAVAGAGDVDRVEVARPDRAVHVRVDEVQPGHRAEVAEQARLHVLGPERLAQERVVEQVDLTDREVVGGAPVGVQQLQLGRTHAGSISRSGAVGRRRACRRYGYRPGRCRGGPGLVNRR